MSDIQVPFREKPLPEKYSDLLNRHAKIYSELSLCKQFLAHLKDLDFGKIGAAEVFKKDVDKFLNGLEK